MTNSDEKKNRQEKYVNKNDLEEEKIALRQTHTHTHT